MLQNIKCTLMPEILNTLPRKPCIQKVLDLTMSDTEPFDQPGWSVTSPRGLYSDCLFQT